MSLEGRKVYFPVESVVGLGHFNRAGKLVDEMGRAGMDVAVASGTFVDPKRFFAGAKLCEMPPYIFTRVNDRLYTLREDGRREIVDVFNEQAWREMRIAKHLEYAGETRPDAVISEFWPFDRYSLDQEMAAMIDHCRLKYDSACIVSVRDVLEGLDKAKDTEENRQELARCQRWAAQTINEKFDAVLVHGDPGFVSLDETFPNIADIKKDIIYTGYIIHDLPRRTPPAVKNGTLLVSCGSGVDGDELLLSFLTSWEKLLDRRHDPKTAFVVERPVHIVCGPRFNERKLGHVKEWIALLQENHPDINITADGYRPDYTDLLARAAFSLSLAGYNTTLETLALGTPALFVPKFSLVRGKLRQSSEQHYRLERLQKEGVASFADPRTVLNSNDFADMLVKEIAGQLTAEHPPVQLNFNGAKNTVEAMKPFLKPR